MSVIFFLLDKVLKIKKKKKIGVRGANLIDPSLPTSFAKHYASCKEAKRTDTGPVVKDFHNQSNISPMQMLWTEINAYLHYSVSSLKSPISCILLISELPNWQKKKKPHKTICIIWHLSSPVVQSGSDTISPL